MKKAAHLAASAALLLGGAMPAAESAGSADLSIAGTITNASEGAVTPAGLVVIASQLDSENNEIERRRADAAPDGSYAIGGFDPARGSHFVVGTDYLGVTYSRLEEYQSGPELRVDLEIFETTEDDSVVRIPSDVTTIVRGEENTFEVIQIQRVVNTSDRTFVGRLEGDRRVVLRLPVPPGSFDLTPLEGISPAALGTGAGGLTTGTPLLPGDASLSWLYKVTIPRVWSLNRQVFYPTEQADLLVEEDLVMTSPMFEFEERVSLSDRSYRRYRGGPLEPGDVVTAEVRVAAASPGSPLIFGLVGGLLLVSLAGAGTLAARRRQRSRRGLREALVEQIAALDEAFGAGEVQERDYRGRRQDLKARVRRLDE